MDKLLPRNGAQLNMEHGDVELIVYDSDSDPDKNQNHYWLRIGSAGLIIKNREQLQTILQMMQAIDIDNPIHAEREDPEVDEMYSDNWLNEFIQTGDPDWMVNPYNGHRRNRDGKIYDDEGNVIFDPAEDKDTRWGYDPQDYDYYP